MRVFVMADMEGISGICRSTQVQTLESPDYQGARRYLTWDVNACVRGLFDGGASRVVVRDAHSSGFNLLWHELDERADYIQGHCAAERMPGIGGFDALVLLGYHAMGGTENGMLEHTFSGKSWQRLWLNGVESGEVAVDAAIAGENGVPTIMVSGDDKVCAEAKKIIHGIATSQVKKGLAREGGLMLPPNRAHELIRKTAESAVKKIGKIKPYVIKPKVTCRLELVSRGVIPVERPNVKVVGKRTYEVTGGSVHAAIRAL